MWVAVSVSWLQKRHMLWSVKPRFYKRSLVQILPCSKSQQWNFSFAFAWIFHTCFNWGWGILVMNWNYYADFAEYTPFVVSFQRMEWGASLRLISWILSQRPKNWSKCSALDILFNSFIHLLVVKASFPVRFLRQTSLKSKGAKAFGAIPSIQCRRTDFI